MKRIFVLLLTLGLLVAMVGAGFAAWFSDTETSADNVFTAGTLDLKVDGRDDPAVVHIEFDNIKPGDGYAPGGNSVLGPKQAGSICHVYSLTNTGTVAGELSVRVENVRNHDWGCTEPELLEDSNCGGSLTGELGQYLHMRIKAPGFGTEYGRKVNQWNNLAIPNRSMGVKWNPMTPGKTVPIEVCFGVPETAGNFIQSDKVEFDIVFDLKQVDERVK